MAAQNAEQKQIDDKYFDSYNDLEIHRLMIDDKPRTQAYCDAIMQNAHLFKDQIVMDVGAGSGILSLFAARAGAKIVHSVEASPMAKLISSIADANNLKDRIKVHQCRVESLTMDDLNGCRVDIIISEWMGFYLLHENMLSSVLFARDQFLKENAMIFPRIAKLYASPCNLSSHYSKYISFWQNVYGFSFKPLLEKAKELRLQRPEIDWIDDKQLLSKKKLILKLDLLTMKLSDIELIQKELFFVIDDGGDNDEWDRVLDGICLWFDCIFTNDAERKSLIVWNTEKKKDEAMEDKKEKEVFNRIVLSTSPSAPHTHWKQTLLFLPQRIKVKKDDVFGFGINMKPSKDNYRLYNIELNLLPSDHVQCQLLRAMMKAH